MNSQSEVAVAGVLRDAAILGWHDSHCASVAILDAQGHVLYASAEERFNKKKAFTGYPAQAIADATRRLEITGLPTGYQDLPGRSKFKRNWDLIRNSSRNGLNTSKSLSSILGTAVGRVSRGQFRGVAGTDSDFTGKRLGYDFLCDHHTAHACSAYYLSGFREAWVVTVDGVGDCLSGTVWEAKGGDMKVVHQVFYNEFPVGANYEIVTALLGFNPDRHCGKITGLAAFGSDRPEVDRALGEFLEKSWAAGEQNWFDRMHGATAATTLARLRSHRDTTFKNVSKEDMAYAIQKRAENQVLQFITEHVNTIQGRNIAVAGGVFANVRINQKVKELGFKNIFIQPAMDDGGLSVGVALSRIRAAGIPPHRLKNAFLGPGFEEGEMEEALQAAKVSYTRIDHMASALADLLVDGKVIARYDGRMEFGPRALGNRSILYHTRDPSVNTWLNNRLSRTEFMPFAPATLAEQADRCYLRADGCRHAAEFMTITFDCTPFMKETSPAVVHVDGTARGQFVTEDANPGFHEILTEYHRKSGIPSLVNTSFNMHESPIVCTPEDAIQSFQEGRLDYLALGPFLVKA